VKLHVREWGKVDAPPVLFIHGWSQNHLCWRKQYESQLADAFHLVAFDLRGHGMSEAPEAQEHYTEPQPWADDIAAIIDQLGLKHLTLVGWSYAGFVICDYVRSYGQNVIAGINFVGAAVTLDRAAFGVLDRARLPRSRAGRDRRRFPLQYPSNSRIRAWLHLTTPAA
jgi:pimeloyl-ACP methyl ester carboxylesterase